MTDNFLSNNGYYNKGGLNGKPKEPRPISPKGQSPDDKYELIFKQLIHERNELRKYIIDICKSLSINTSQSVLGANCLEFYAVLTSTVKNRRKGYEQTLIEIGELIPKFESSSGCDYGDFDCENCSDLDEDTVCAYKLKKVIKGIINKARGSQMTKLFDLATEVQETGLFDLEAIMHDWGYDPFYDDLVRYCKSKDVAVNYGITRFDWIGSITKDEAIEFLKKKYSKYIVNNS